jgi:hypothetical protein
MEIFPVSLFSLKSKIVSWLLTPRPLGSCPVNWLRPAKITSSEEFLPNPSGIEVKRLSSMRILTRLAHFARDDGIAPSKLLLFRAKCCKLPPSHNPSGKVPLKKLSDKATYEKFGMYLPKSRGMGPDKLLLYISSLVRLVRLMDKLVGICPVRPLLDNSRSFKLTSDVKLSGIGPVRLLVESIILVKLTSSPRDGGMEPFSSLPRRTRIFSDVMFPSQGGISPARFICPMSRVLIKDMFRSSGGTPPVKLLPPRFNVFNFTNLPSSSGIWPPNPPVCPSLGPPTSLLIPKLKITRVVAFPIDGGKVPEKLLDSIHITSMAGSFDKSSKTAHGKGHSQFQNYSLIISSFLLNGKFESLIWTLLMNELLLSPHEAILPRKTSKASKC